MNNNLSGWELIEGRIDMLRTPTPEVSDVITALESIRPDMDHAFIILVAPAEEGAESNYCQVYAYEVGYVCEIRVFSPGGFCHWRSFLRDAEGSIGSNEGPFPNLSQTIRIFTSFISDPTVAPVVDDVVWMDVSGEFDPVPA